MNWSWKRFFIILPIVFALVWSTLALASCASSVRGTITEKEVEVTVKRKKLKTCYELEVTDAAGVETDICVSKSTYDSYVVGDKYP